MYGADSDDFCQTGSQEEPTLADKVKVLQYENIINVYSNNNGSQRILSGMIQYPGNDNCS